MLNLEGTKIAVGNQAEAGKHAVVTFAPVIDLEQAEEALTAGRTLLEVDTSGPPGAKTGKNGETVSYGWKFDGEYRTPDARNIQVRAYGDIRIPAKQPTDANPDATVT